MFSARTGEVANTEWKPLIKGIVRVSRERYLHRSAKTGLWSSTSEEWHITSLVLPSCGNHAATTRSEAIGTSRTNYITHTRDVTFQEDQSRIRHNPGVFARIRSFGYNILRRNQTRTFSQDRNMPPRSLRTRLQ